LYHDLFISYTSADRSWAERFYVDFTHYYPWRNVFFDRVSIRGGAEWRFNLNNAMPLSKHLVLFWSKVAKESVEVQDEIADFKAERSRIPNLESVGRLPFPIQLDTAPIGWLQEFQGFPGFQKYYEPSAPDRGVGSLDSNPSAGAEWKRALEMIENSIGVADDAIELTAGIMAMNIKSANYLNGVRQLDDWEESLGDFDKFFSSYNLTWEQVRERYGDTCFAWKPFGGSETIVSSLEDLRRDMNATLKKDRFKWIYRDLTDQVVLNQMTDPSNPPIIVIVDPVSLFVEKIANKFRSLGRHLNDELSAFVSLAPVGLSQRDWLRETLQQRVIPALNDYFEPKIPPLGSFATCDLNVQRISEIQRLVRRRIGFHRREQELQLAKNTVGMAR
jgi:hypothetical protein